MVPQPLDLNPDRARHSDRGLPAIATPEAGRAIADMMAAMSRPSGTVVECDTADGSIAVRAG